MTLLQVRGTEAMQEQGYNADIFVLPISFLPDWILTWKNFYWERKEIGSLVLFQTKACLQLCCRLSCHIAKTNWSVLAIVSVSSYLLWDFVFPGYGMSGDLTSLAATCSTFKNLNREVQGTVDLFTVDKQVRMRTWRHGKFLLLIVHGDNCKIVSQHCLSASCIGREIATWPNRSFPLVAPRVLELEWRGGFLNTSHIPVLWELILADWLLTCKIVEP